MVIQTLFSLLLRLYVNGEKEFNPAIAQFLPLY